MSKSYVNESYSLLLGRALTSRQEVESRNGKVFRCFNGLAGFSGTPLVSLRKTAWRTAIREMEWFLSGSVCIYDAPRSVREWWAPWADKVTGVVHNSYGKQLRRFWRGTGSVDQIGRVISSIEKDPYSRRHVITTWNAGDMLADPKTPIANCHGTVIQFFVNNANELNMTMYQRSADLIVGVPHNWIQYWALLKYIAHQTDKSIGGFSWFGGDCHIYEAHKDLALKIRDTMKKIVKLRELTTPELVYTPTSEKFLADDFSLSTPYRPLIDKSAKPII